MAVPYRQWLAEQILSGKQIVSYRTLSRALEVHINAAKRMLYDFYVHENSKKPGSVHATYLLAGSKKAVRNPLVINRQNGNQHEDDPMPSSPPPFTSSMLQSSQQNGGGEEVETSVIRTISLVREESLDAVRLSYETVTSIHIYALTCSRLQDLQTLSDTGRHLYSTHFVKEDPLEHNVRYGVIVNKGVRRRTGRRPPPPTLESKPLMNSGTASKASSKAAENIAAGSLPSVKKEETSRPSSSGSTGRTFTSSKQPSLKRDTSDIFKSFAKAKNATAKSTPTLNRNETDSSVDNTCDEKDIKLPHSSEGEGESEEEAFFLDTQTRTSAKKRPSTGKAERAAKLRKMMDDSDEEMEAAELMDPEEAGLGPGDKPGKAGKSQEAALKQGPSPTTADADEAEEAEAVNWSDSDTERQNPIATSKPRPNPKPEPTPEPEPEAAPRRRRRGKRKIMKKKTMKDEEGYLVTREEAVWESFSEDEPVPAKTKPNAVAVAAGKGKGAGKSGEKAKQKGAAAAAGGGGGSSGGGGGAGNIMSFFGKK